MNATPFETETDTQEDYDFRSRLAAYVRSQALPIDKLGHQPRLYALTQLVGQGMSYDDDVVYAAAWLHDLGVFIGHRPEDPEALSSWDNVSYAMKQAPRVLARCGFPATKVAPVVEAIRTHQPHLSPTSVEGAILRDADILEQLGAIGILRVVAKIGRDTRYPTFTDAAGTLRKALADLPGNLHLHTAKALAQPKIDLLESFLRAMDNESHGALC
ncbi:MAG: phosphohydrolase [Acidobacteriaceae bacterium]